MTQLDRRRFEALAGYTRHPAITLLTKELDWFSDPGERVLGTLVWDRVDDDYGWAVFGRDAADRFRAVQANTSYATSREAYDALMQAMSLNAAKPDEAFHQGDETGPAVDFFVPVIDEDRFHPSFRMLAQSPRTCTDRGYEEHKGNE